MIEPVQGPAQARHPGVNANRPQQPDAIVVGSAFVAQVQRAGISTVLMM